MQDQRKEYRLDCRREYEEMALQTLLQRAKIKPNERPCQDVITVYLEPKVVVWINLVRTNLGSSVQYSGKGFKLKNLTEKSLIKMIKIY